MRKLSRAMTPIPDNPYVEYIGTPLDTPFRFGPRWHFGDNNAPDGDYEWLLSDQTTWKAKPPHKTSADRAYNPNEKNDCMTADESSMPKPKLHSAQSDSS